MSNAYSVIANVPTAASDTSPEPDDDQIIEDESLERHPSILISRTFTGGRSEMIEIITYKSQGGRSLVKQFSNSYLFNGTPNYLSDAAKTLAEKIVEAERRIYFDDTHFMRYVIRQLGADGRHIYGETRTEAVNFTGETALPVGSKIVPPNIVARYEKKVDVGRNALTLYRNVINTDEYNTYLETGAVPARLQVAYAPGVLPLAVFSQALMDADNDSGLTMMLPLNNRYSAGAVRPVTSITFAGMGFRQETYQRDTGTENMLEAVQQLINENGAAMRRLLRSIADATGAMRTGLVNTIIQLVVDAFAKYALLSIARRAAIRFPAIYFAAELLALLPAGTIPALT